MGYGVGLRVEKRVTEKESRGESQVERRGEGNRSVLCAREERDLGACECK